MDGAMGRVAYSVHAEQTNLKATLVNLARGKYVKLNWETSIVDLLKLLGLDSSPGAREQLAKRLHVCAGQTGSPKQNTALYNAVLKELAIAEAKRMGIMESRRSNGRCLNCGSNLHLESRCPDSCGKCTAILLIEISDLLITTLLGLYPGYKVLKCGYFIRCNSCEFSHDNVACY